MYKFLEKGASTKLGDREEEQRYMWRGKFTFYALSFFAVCFQHDQGRFAEGRSQVIQQMMLALGDVSQEM